jgi:hypothetical protein
MGLSFSVTPKVQEDFSGGQNDRDNPAIISGNEAALIQNWHIDKKGKLYKRGGLTLYGNDVGSAKILGLSNFYRGQTNYDLVMMAATTLYYYNTGTWTALDDGFTTSLDTEFEIAKDILFMTNGTDNVHSWDRSSTTLNSCLVDEGNGSSDPPRCVQMKWFSNYMFFVDGTTSLYVSDLNDPQTCVRASNYFVFSEPLIAIGELKDFLVIFSQRKVWTLQIVGTTLSNWLITPVNDALGCVARRSIQRVDNDLYYLSNDGVRSLLLTAEDKVRVGRLSDKVKTTIDSINTAQIFRACSAFYNNRYYVFIPTGSSAVPNTGLVLNYDTETGVRGWVTITGWTPSIMVVRKNTTSEALYFGESNADTKVYQAESGSTDNGTNIDADLKTKAWTMDFPDRYKRWYRLDTFAYDGGDYDLTIQQDHDDGGFETLDSMDLETGSPTIPFALPATLDPVEQSYRASTGFTALSRQLQLRFRNNQATSSTIIHKYVLHYKLRKYGY